MTTFVFRCRDAAGEVRSVEIASTSREAAIDLLMKRGMTVLEEGPRDADPIIEKLVNAHRAVSEPTQPAPARVFTGGAAFALIWVMLLLGSIAAVIGLPLGLAESAAAERDGRTSVGAFAAFNWGVWMVTIAIFASVALDWARRVDARLREIQVALRGRG